MRLSKNDYKILGYFIFILFLCWGLRFIYLVRPQESFPLNLKWQRDLGNSTYERPVYYNNLILFPANNFAESYWYGLEAVTGKTSWSHPAERRTFLRCLSPEYLVISGFSSLLVLDPMNGDLLWQGKRAETATCSDKVLFYNGVPKESISAFNLITRQNLWVGTTPWRSVNGLIYNHEEKELVANGSLLPADIYIIDPNSGLIEHSFNHITYPPTDGGRGPIYIVDRGELFIGGTVVDAQTGEVIHRESYYGTDTWPTVTVDSMYLSSGAWVVAFDRTNYKIKWVYPSTPNFIVYSISPVTILNDVGYVIYSDATLRAFDLETGQELGYWQPTLLDRLLWPVCAPLPFPFCTGFSGVGMTASEDTLFVSFGDGKLYAFGG